MKINFIYIFNSFVHSFIHSFIHSYSALEAGLEGTRAQSCDRYGSGTLHHGQVLGGSLPLLSPGLLIMQNKIWNINIWSLTYLNIFPSQIPKKFTALVVLQTSNKIFVENSVGGGEDSTNHTSGVHMQTLAMTHILLQLTDATKWQSYLIWTTYLSSAKTGTAIPTETSSPPIAVTFSPCC